MSITPSIAVDNVKKPSMPISNGITLYVGGLGPGNYTKIQDAIDNASDEDTVYVYSGTYYENIVINKTINLIGEIKHDTIIDSKRHGHVIKIYSDYVNISGFTIQNSSSDGGLGIYGKGNFLIVHDNNIKNHDGYGIEFESSSDCIISENTLNNNDDGILLLKGRGHLIINNNITYNNDHGIMLSTDNTRSCIIINNNISFNRRGGMWIFDSNTHIISNNYILNNERYGINLYGTGNTIENNVISHNSGGIDLDGSKNKIINNTISNNVDYGIIVNSVIESNTIKGNVISNNKDGIILESGCRHNTINDNTFFNNGLFVISPDNSFNNNTVNGKPLVVLKSESNKVIQSDAGQVILLNCDKITIQNLDLSNTTVGIELYSSSNCLISNNMLTNNNRYGIYIKGGSNTVCWNHIENCNDAIYISGSDNEISYNNIYKNSNGIFWYGQSNTVKNNNFISNLHNAKFRINYNGGLTTKWRKNYWERTRILPKAIMGKKDIFLFEFIYSDIILPIPWISFDWHPAKEPYDIEGVI